MPEIQLPTKIVQDEIKANTEFIRTDAANIATQVEEIKAISNEIKARPDVTYGIQRFTADGIFTVPEGVTKVYVSGVGGGASGYSGYSGQTGNYSYNSSVTGAMGIRIPVAVVPGQTIAVTIGKGGESVRSDTAGQYVRGNSGTSSAFGSYVVFDGGPHSSNSAKVRINGNSLYAFTESAVSPLNPDYDHYIPKLVGYCVGMGGINNSTSNASNYIARLSYGFPIEHALFTAFTGISNTAGQGGKSVPALQNSIKGNDGALAVEWGDVW